MRYDTANRSFFVLVAIALVPYAVLGLFGCGFLSLMLYRLGSEGFGSVTGSLWPAVGLFALVGAGTLAGIWSLRRQLQATQTLVDHIHRSRVSPDDLLREQANRVGLANRIDVIDDAAPFSFTYGLIWPRVVISTGLLGSASRDELEAVLEHESYHVRNLDPLKMLVARTAPRAFFYLPTLHDYRRRYVVGRELAADRRAVRAHGRRALAGALYKAVRGPAWSELAMAAAIGGDELLDVRIAQLETGNEPPISGASGGALAVTVFVMALLVAAFVGTLISFGGPTELVSGSASSNVSAAPAVNLLGCLVCCALWAGLGWAAYRRRRSSRRA